TNSLEFYLAGNVEIRTQTTSKDGPNTETLRADEVYYDVGRNVAIALKSDLEIRKPKLPYPIHVQAEEFFRLNASLYQAQQTQVFSTILPSDPGLKIEIRQTTIEERQGPKKTIFGQAITRQGSGEAIENKEHYFTGRDMVVRVEGVPVFYFPYLSGRVEDPLGPLDGVNFGFNRPFGFFVMTTWDIYDLIGRERPRDSRWQLMLDYLTRRGPALGMDFQTRGRNAFNLDNYYEGRLLAWGIYDQGTDILGGNRGTDILIAPPNITQPVSHPDWRGRVLGEWNVQELPYGFTLQAQLGLLSDHNVLEQFYKQDFDNALNQETTLYLKQQVDRWAWTLLVEPRLRYWVTETEWLPKADGYLLGQKLLDLFTYNARAGIGYAQLKPAEAATLPYMTTDAATNTSRLYLMQDLSLPFQAGPFRLVPYGVLGLMHYSQDLSGDDQGRLYGGGGLRASIPLSRLYGAVESDLFNLDGLYHKMVFSAHWFVAASNTRLSTLPQLDRLNDDATDQSLRDIRPHQPLVNPANAAFLTTSLLFDPQYYALRRLIDTRIDSLDQINVVQLDLRQRWQTKRGLPGHQHIID
ncbi:MAG: hypothetical protein NZO58_14625, partial [Gemmataceae bacterium]|nr:hypothetical protein [Gemmataceae bacterium]